MQLHYGAQRNTNTVMFNKLGADTGFDCISVKTAARRLRASLTLLMLRASFRKLLFIRLIPMITSLQIRCSAVFRAPRRRAKFSTAPLGGSAIPKAVWRRSLNRLPTFRFSEILWVCLPSQGAFCPTPATRISEEYSAIFWANGWNTANIPTIK